MIVPNMYGKEPGSYAHGLVRCASSPQMQGLERHLQLLYSQRLEAGDTEREEELQTQIEAAVPGALLFDGCGKGLPIPGYLCYTESQAKYRKRSSP